MKLCRTLLVTATIAALGAGGVLAHSGATGIIKERMDAMKDIGKAMKSLGTMAKGEKPFSPEKVKAASETIIGHAGTIDRMFPDTEKSRKGHMTEAAPAIWEDKPAFLALAKEMADAAASLKAVSASGELGTPLGVLGKTCKSCHEKFRIKKN